MFYSHYNLIRLTVALAALAASSCVHAEEKCAANELAFVCQGAANSFDRHICVGLAGGIECLEEGTKAEGVESSKHLASRVWNELTNPDGGIVYYTQLRLRDGTISPICSKDALEEVGYLIQQEYNCTVQRKLWKEQVDPDPNTSEGRMLLETRQKYLNLLFADQTHKTASQEQLVDLLNKDKDGLVSFAARGQRLFESGPPRRVIDKFDLQLGTETGEYANATPSRHAFLMTYDEDTSRFYVYDSDDPSAKWPATVEGSGACHVRESRPHRCTGFRIHWRIDDHMGNGPTRQTYCDIRPLKRFLGEIRSIAEGSSHAASKPFQPSAIGGVQRIETADSTDDGAP